MAGRAGQHRFRILTFNVSFVLVCVSLLLAQARPAYAVRSRGVSSDNTRDYTTIAAAIAGVKKLWEADKSEPYVIYIYEGYPNQDYDENLYVRDAQDRIISETMVIDFPVSLIGVSSARSVTILPAGGFDPDRGPLLTIDGSKVAIGRDVVISGLSFTGAVAVPALGSRVCNGAVRIINASPTFANNVIFDNKGTDGTIDGPGRGGGLCLQNSNALVVGNTIVGNDAVPDFANRPGQGGGVYIWGGAPLLRDNQIVGNAASYSRNGEGGGVAIYNSNAVLEGNLITGNVASRCLRQSKPSGGAPCNDVTGQGGGVYVSGGSPTLRFNTIRSNNAGNARGAGGGAVSLLDTTNAVLLGNEIVDNFDASMLRSGDSPDLRSNGLRIANSGDFLVDSNIIARNRFGDPGDDRQDEAGVTILGTSRGLLRHNTIADNGRPGGTGRTFGVQIAEAAQVTLANNIFAGYDVAVFCANSPCNASARLSQTLFDREAAPRFQPAGPWFTSEAERFDDPRFVAPGDPIPNYRVRGDSPARDGAVATDPAVLADVDRNARAIGPPDLGAHEFPYSVSLSVNADEAAAPGAPVSFALSFEVNGNVAAPGAALELALPPGTTVIDPGGGAIGGETVRWQLGDLLPGTQRRITVTANAPPAPGQTLAVTARWTSADGSVVSAGDWFRVVAPGLVPERISVYLPVLRRS